MYNILLSGIPLNIDWRQILLHLLNLVILFLILYFLLYNPVKKFMEKRKKFYEDRDEKSKADLAAAKEEKDTYDGLIAKADEEISEKKRSAIADARDESEKIIKSAEETSADIIRKAEARAEEIKKRAEEEAKEELSDVIAKAAKEKIEKACSVDGFLSENMKNDG
ncbi:MAG TPA: hypothetical protein DHU65_00845 [Clostridiales bacterium]|nr:hypothetical protein [Clostridiales bacterium]